MNIQWPNERDHFFEGWYHRFVDRKNKVSLVVITTAYNTRGLTRPGLKNGYISLILKKDGFPPVLHQKVIEEVFLTEDRENGYQLTLPDIGYVSDKEFELEIENLKVKSFWSNEKRLPWPASKVSGLDTPTDIAAFIPVFPTHWHVHNMGGTAHYEVSSSDASYDIKGTASFHHEKNWGKVFPEYWYWLDVMDQKQEVYISGAGGKIKLAGLNIPAFMLAIRTPVGVIKLSPLNKLSRYEIETDNCTSFKISGSDKNLIFELELADKDENFFNLLIPTDRGYVPGALESLTAKASLKIWRKTPRGKRTFLASYMVDQSALEFGNEAYQCD